MRRWSSFVHRCIVHRSEPWAVSRKPMADRALVYELCRLAEEETTIVKGEREW